MTKLPTIGDCAGGHRVENREKNRDVSTVPRKYIIDYQVQAKIFPFFFL